METMVGESLLKTPAGQPRVGLAAREGEVGLPTFFREIWPSLSFRERCALVRELGRFISDEHAGGRWHRSLSNSVSVSLHAGGWRFASDGGVRRLPFSSCRGKRMAELAGLYASFLPGCTRAVSLRFLQGYLGEADKEGRRRWCTVVEEKALSLARARWRRGRRQLLGAHPDFVREKREAFRILRRRGSLSQAALSALLPDPDQLLGGGEVMFGRGNSCLSAKVRIGSRFYILKKYHCRGWTYRIRHLFRRSRALRNWVAAWGFRQLGLPLPEPLLCLEERRLGLLERSYTLTEFFEGSVRLSDIYSSQGPSWRRSLLTRVAIILGTMHRFRAVHGDTNWDNILVRSEGNDFAIALIDLDGSRLLYRARPDRCARDIWHFVRDMKRRGGDCPAEIELFTRCWRRWSG